MALFNFSFNANNNSEDKDAVQQVELQLNEESITVSAAEVKGLTVEEVFTKFCDRLGDVTRISKFVAAGRIVDSSSEVKPGMIYRGAISSESKG